MGNAQGVCSNGDAVPDAEDGAEEGQISMMSGLTRMSLAGSPSKNAPVAVTSPRKKQEREFRTSVWPFAPSVAAQRKAVAHVEGPNPVLSTILRDWEDVNIATPRFAALDPPRAAEHQPESITEAAANHAQRTIMMAADFHEDLLDAAQDLHEAASPSRKASKS